MPLPELLPWPEDFLDPVHPPDHCELAGRWGIHPDLALRLMTMSQRERGFRISVISGARSLEEQEALQEQGRPAAPWHLTTHANAEVDCTPRLATGVDLMVSVAPVQAVKERLGVLLFEAGLRWGGGSPLSSDGLTPTDWNHADMGPRG
jgi:hypothetical protein